MDKHAKMVSGSKVEEENSGAADSGSGADDGGMGFGQNKKALAADVQERRRQQMQDAEDRYKKGEAPTTGMPQAGQSGASGGADADVLAVDKQRKGESKQYAWWADQRCKEKNIPEVETKINAGDSKANEDDPASEQSGDIALTEPGSVKE